MNARPMTYPMRMALSYGIAMIVLGMVSFLPASALAADRFILGSQGDLVGGTILADRGGQATLMVSFEVDEATSGANITVQLPDGVSLSHVNLNTSIAPPNDFTIVGSNLPNNRASLLVYSSTNTLQQSQGVLAAMHLNVSNDAPLGNFPVTIETHRERDVKSYEVRTPRGLSNQYGESRPSQATHCSMTINPAGNVIFTDSTLEDDIIAILAGLGHNVGSFISPIEIVGVGFTSYNGDNMGITSISGLEYATDLQSLSLEMNDIQDIGPLATLTNLTSLSLSGNRIKDLTPLSNLVNLQELHLQFNEIDDISPLAALPNLSILTLSGNHISDLSALSGMTNLTMLYLDDNQISDVSPLQGLTNLSILFLDWNQIGHITPLTANPGISAGDLVSVESNPLDETIFCNDMDYLYIEGVNLIHNVVACDGGVDVIPDVNLRNAVRTQLTNQGNPPGTLVSAFEVGLLTALTANGQGIESLEGLQYATNLTTLVLDNNDISDLGPLEGLSNLDTVGFGNNNISNAKPLLGSANSLRVVNLKNNLISDVSPFGQMVDLEQLWLNENLVFDISPLSGLDSLEVLLLPFNQIVDITALKTMINLDTASLRGNFIGNIEALLDFAGSLSGAVFDFRDNPLNAHAHCELIGIFESGGASILENTVMCSDFIDSWEPDGKAATARVIEPGQMRSEMSLIEILPNVPDQDWVKFELENPAQVTIQSSPGTLESSALELRATVYNSNQSPLGSSSGPIVLDLVPGTYYVRTDELAGRVVGNYAIRVAVDEEEYTGDDSAADATQLVLGTPSTKHTLTKGDFGMETVATFPMDSNPGWTTTGLWAFGVPNGVGDLNAPSSGATGSNVYAVNLTGNYPAIVDTEPRYLTTTAIDCSRSQNTYLQFERFLNTDYPNYVDTTLEVSNDGNTWHQVWSTVPGVFVWDTNWNTQTYDISQWADGHSSVYIRWGYYLRSTGAIPYSGWYVDDVRILGNVSPVTEDVDWFKFNVNVPAFIKMRADAAFGRAKLELFGPNDATKRISQRYVSDNKTMFFQKLPVGQYFVRVSEYPPDREYDYGISVPEYVLKVEVQGTPDSFEFDDNFQNATPIDLDPIVAGGVRVVKQTHNFHAPGDEDWCVLVIPRKEIHPRLELTDLGPRANPQIDVFASDGTTLLRSGSGNILIDFNTQDDERFYIRVRNNDPNAFGPDTAYGISGIGGIEIGGFVVGYVRDQFGQPVPNIQLRIPKNNKPDIISTPSAPDGFYTFPNVPLGEHTALYQSPCGLELSVTFTIVDAKEHNVPVQMIGCTDPNEIFVNVDIISNANENGTLPNPFSSLAEGVAVVNPGGTIRVKGLASAELFVAGTSITKPMTLIGENIDGITPVMIGE